jgi:hypothetical protein
MSQVHLGQSSDFFIFIFNSFHIPESVGTLRAVQYFQAFGILEKLNDALGLQAYIKKHKLFQNCAILNSKVLKIQDVECPIFRLAQ